MSVSLADITEDMIAEDQVRFPRVFSLSRRDKVIRTLVLGGGMLILLYGLNRFGFFGEKFWGSLGKMVVFSNWLGAYKRVYLCHRGNTLHGYHWQFDWGYSGTSFRLHGIEKSDANSAHTI